MATTRKFFPVAKSKRVPSGDTVAASGGVKKERGHTPAQERAREKGIGKRSKEDRAKKMEELRLDMVRKKEALLARRKELTAQRRTIWYQHNKEDLRQLTVTQRTFLKTYTEELSVRKAQRIVGIDPTAVHYWKKQNPTFKRLYEDLQDYVINFLEDEIYRRAFHGTEETIFYQGEPCGTKTNFSDTLAMFILRAANPEKYRERSSMDMNVKSIGEGIDPQLATGLSRDALRQIREIVENDQLKQKLIEGEASAA